MITGLTESVIEEAALRDTLLHKLLSGKIQVTNAGRLIAEATT
jgi:hypothetical protein